MPARPRAPSGPRPCRFPRPSIASLIRPAADQLAARLAELPIQAPRIPVVNNVDVAVESDPARIKDALVRQAYNPVRWVETIQKMAAMARDDGGRVRPRQGAGRPRPSAAPTDSTASPWPIWPPSKPTSIWK